jgi:hypothetical protein
VPFVELRCKAAEHFLVGTTTIIGFDEFSFAFEIADADIFANAAPPRGQLGEGGWERFNTEPIPPHAALVEQRIAESLAIISADIDEDSAALTAKEILEQEPVLPDLRIEFHDRALALRASGAGYSPQCTRYTASTPDTSGM